MACSLDPAPLTISPQPTPWRDLSFSPPLNTIAHSHKNNKFAHKVYRGVPRQIKRAGLSHSKHFFLEQIRYTGRTLIYQQNPKKKLEIFYLFKNNNTGRGSILGPLNILWVMLLMPSINKTEIFICLKTIKHRKGG